MLTIFPQGRAEGNRDDFCIIRHTQAHRRWEERKKKKAKQNFQNQSKAFLSPSVSRSGRRHGNYIKASGACHSRLRERCHMYSSAGSSMNTCHTSTFIRCTLQDKARHWKVPMSVVRTLALRRWTLSIAMSWHNRIAKGKGGKISCFKKTLYLHPGQV